VISVHELSIFKPAPMVYELAVEKLRVAKEKIGFVSSNSWDALGAKSYGFTVFWLNRAGARLDRLGFKPDRIVARLDEILL
jgi:2-haloacid dehalogenase